MAFKDLFLKKYSSNVWCNNCNSHSEVQISKGVTLNQFVESGKCPNCGCVSLVVGYKQIYEFKKEAPNTNTTPRRVAPLPERRPSTRPPVGYVDLTREKLKPQDFSLTPPLENEEDPKVYKDFDYWTGMPRKKRK
jgi:hypothetical protein